MSRTAVHQGENRSRSPQRKPSRTPRKAKPTPFGKMDPNGNIFPVTPTRDGASENKRDNPKSSNINTKINFNKETSKQTTPTTKGRRSRSVPSDPKHEDSRSEAREVSLNSSQESPARLPGFYSNNRSCSRRRDYQGRGRSEFRRRNGDHFSQDRFRHVHRGGADARTPRGEFPPYIHSNGYYPKPHHQRNRSANSLAPSFGHQFGNQIYPHHGEARQQVYAQRGSKERTNAPGRYEEREGRQSHIYSTNNEDNAYRRASKTDQYQSKSKYTSNLQNSLYEYKTRDKKLDYRGQSNDLNQDYKESKHSRSMSRHIENNRSNFKNHSSPVEQNNKSNLYTTNNINTSPNGRSEPPSRLECIVNEFSHNLRRELSAEMIKAEEFHIPMNFKLDFLNETESVSSSSKLNPKATEFQPVTKDTSVVTEHSTNLVEVKVSEPKIDNDDDQRQLEDNARILHHDNASNHNARLVNLSNLANYPANLSNLNQLMYTQPIPHDQIIQMTNSPLLQNSSGQMFLSTPPPPLGCQPSSNCQNFQMYNPNGFHTIQPAHVPQINSQPQFGQGLMAFPSQHQYNLAELYAPPDNTIIYGSPNMNGNISAIPMTPVLATQISAQLSNQNIGPLSIYNGQPLSFPGMPNPHTPPVLPGMPSAPTQPVMTRMEMPRQAYPDPRTVPGQQILQPPPVMNFQTYCLTMDNEHPLIRQNVKLSDHGQVCKTNEEQKPTLIERVGDTLKEVRESLKKRTSSKSRSLETWEEIILKLMKSAPVSYSESKSLGPLHNSILTHLREAREESVGTVTDLDIFQEIVDLTWPIVSLDIHSSSLNSSLAKIMNNKNLGPSKDPVKDARIHRSRRNFLKAWCGIALEGFKHNPNRKPKNVNENENIVKVDQISDEVRCEQTSNLEEADSLGSNFRYNDDAIISSEDDVMPPFEEISETSKDCKTRRESLRGVCVGNRISYFESNAKSDAANTNERKK